MKHVPFALILAWPVIVSCTKHTTSLPNGTSATSSVSIYEIAERSRIYSNQFQKFRSKNGYTRFNSSNGKTILISAALAGDLELDGQVRINGALPLKYSVKSAEPIMGSLSRGVHINATINVGDLPKQVVLEYNTRIEKKAIVVASIGNDPELGFLYVDKDMIYGVKPSNPGLLIESSSHESRSGYDLVGVDRWGSEVRYYFLAPRKN